MSVAATTPTITSASIDAFINRWKSSGGAERANYQLFLSELCLLLGLPSPDTTKADDLANAYVFEKDVREPGLDAEASRRIDLYKRGCFVLEAKQGVEKEIEVDELVLAKEKKRRKKKGHGTRGTKGWDTFMRRAREQAEAYARLLPPDEGRPPFILVADVGYAIEVYAEFTRTGGLYQPFPNAKTFRINLEDLHLPEIQERLRLIWTDPMRLDPSLAAAEVTREVAAKLAEISKSMEGKADQSGQIMTPERVSGFLMRMIFTMFAEDVGLIPKEKFKHALRELCSTRDTEAFVPMVAELWHNMAYGGYSVALRERIPHFNGGLFEGVEVPPVTLQQLEWLTDAAGHNWSHVEPSIFGTLVERALDPNERHSLGAHYTPRAYVERLVNWTVIAPLRDDWRNVQAIVQKILHDKGESGKPAARKEIEQFLVALQKVHVLDPACGTGNFLYVSMELMKRIEAEALETLEGLGGPKPLARINPEQFLGIELNPRAAGVAELVLWIGYLQLYAREHGKAQPPEPILRDFHNIETRDAVLRHQGTSPRQNKDGTPALRWDGKSTAIHPVTGKPVPDLSKQIGDVTYRSPVMPPWPKADFIVGNPPFIGAGPLRMALGDGYAETIRKVYAGVPQSADFVMYWWWRAAFLLSRSMGGPGELRRFGFVTTNSIKQTFNRRVIEEFVGPGRNISLAYAVPDHPWVDSADGAAVRIAMTVLQRGRRSGLVERVVKEKIVDYGEFEVETRATLGMVNTDLTLGTDVTGAQELKAMADLSNRGVQLLGAGFILSIDETKALGLGQRAGLERHIREYRNGRDLTSRPREVMVIDLFGLDQSEVQAKFPEVYEHVLKTVKPERDANKRGTYRDKWWIFGEPRSAFRPALKGLPRYIATVETSKHRFFQFLDASILPDNKLVAIASDDAYVMGVLSSSLHVAWALAQGSTLEDRPVYVKSRCFETFPFPEANSDQKARIRKLAEQLDEHRKTRLLEHPDLTMTDMYNALEALQSGEPLNGKLKKAHDQGLVSTLKQIHDDLNAEVVRAYGWPEKISETDMLAQLTILNFMRQQEEKAGLVRYLRPEYQDPSYVPQLDLGMEVLAPVAKKEAPVPFPNGLSARVQAVRDHLLHAEQPLTLDEVAGAFVGASAGDVAELVETLVVIGQARVMDVDGEVRYAA